MLVRERFSSISAAVSIRSKPNSRFQTLCLSCISKLRICPRRCVAASFTTRTVSRRRQIVVPRSSDILAKLRSSTVIFQKSDKKRSGSRSPDLEPPTISSKIQTLSGPLAAHFSRSFDRCLLHWRPPCSALGRFLGRVYSTYSSCTPLVPSGPVMFLLFGRCGHRQISTVTL